MAERPLSGKTVVVPTGLAPAQVAALARRLSVEGADVVLVAPEGDAAVEAGRVATDLQHPASHSRAAIVVLTGDQPADFDAVVELVSELFP